MKRKSANRIMEEFFKDYQEDPEGWGFWISESGNYFNVYLTQGNKAYFLKLDSIFTPKPVGIGAEIELEEDQLSENNLPSFGFRKFTSEEVKNFLRSLPSPPKSKKEFGETVKEIDKKVKKTLMEKSTGPFGPLKEPGEMALLGPYIRKNPLSYVSKKQEELDKKLDRELKEISQREYPSYY